MNIVKLGPQYQLHVYLCKIEHEPYMDMFEENSSAEMEAEYESGTNKSDKLAEQLIDSCSDHLSVSDLLSIRKKCAKEIVDCWTKCAPQRLEEEEFKKIVEELKNER